MFSELNRSNYVLTQYHNWYALIDINTKKILDIAKIESDQEPTLFDFKCSVSSNIKYQIEPIRIYLAQNNQEID